LVKENNMPTLADLSDDLLREQSYLVARGVRPLAITGHCTSESLTMLRAATRLGTMADAGAIPFVIDRGDGWADFGFAAARWAVDLYSWLTNNSQDAIPQEQRERILGLLLGYSTEAIRRFEEGQRVLVFTSSTESGPSSQLGGTYCTAETALHS
jgi:hypothetical protein